MADALVVLDLLAKYGYFIVFAAALAESMPLLGMLVPGQAFVIFAGFLASQGTLELGPIILAGIVAGLLGDAIGYVLGRRYGRWLLVEYGPRFRMDARAVDRIDGLFAKYGPLALIAARFSFLTRGLGPLLAGVTRMRLRVFWPLNVVGAIAWAVAYAAMGYLAGESVGLIEGAVGRYVGYGVAAAVGVFLLYRALRSKNPYFTRGDALLALACGACVILFARLANAASGPGPAPLFDSGRDAISAALAPYETLWRVLSFLGDFPVFLVTVALFGLLAWRKRWWDAACYGLAVGGSEILVGTLKVVFDRPRPEDALAVLDSAAFPSGHAARIVVFAGATVYVLDRHLRARSARAGVLLAAIALTLLMGLARLGLRVHYPSDVLGGYLIGAAWLAAVLLVVEFFVKRTPAGPGEPPPPASGAT